MKNVSIPDELAERVQASGADLSSYAVDAIKQKLTRESGSTPESLQSRLAKGWSLPTVKGKPRTDGVAWSEVEAATDAA